ncbi:MAG: hypothetical protein ABSC42_14655 [Tepidisphaeraceae bacterium]|jgi:hypothetical protein
MALHKRLALPVVFFGVFVLAVNASVYGQDETTETTREQLGLTFDGGGLQLLWPSGISSGPQSFSLTPEQMWSIHEADVRHAQLPELKEDETWRSVNLRGPQAKPGQ